MKGTYKELWRSWKSTETKLSNLLLFVDFMYESDVEPPIIVNKDGSVILIAEIEGKDYDGLSVDEANQISHVLKQSLELLEERFEVDVYYKREQMKPVSLFYTPESPDIVKFLQQKKQVFWDAYSNFTYKGSIYVALKYIPQRMSEKDLSTFLSDTKVISLRLKTLEKAAEKLLQGFEVIRKTLEQFTLKELTKKDVYEILYRLVNYKEPGQYNPGFSLNFQIASSQMHFFEEDKEAFVKINNGKIGKVMALKVLPRTSCPLVMRKVLDLPFELLFRVNYTWFSHTKMVNKVGGLYRNIANSIHYHAYIDEADLLVHKVKAEREIPLFMTLNMVVLGETVKDTRMKFKQVQTVMKEDGFEFFSERKNFRNTFFSMLPGHNRYSGRKNLILSSNGGDYFNVYKLSEGDKDPVVYFPDREGGIYSFNPFTTKENSHGMVVLGPTGSGKSFTVNSILSSSLALDPLIYVIDLSKSFTEIFEILKTEMPERTSVLELSHKKISFKFNPFLITPEEFENEKERDKKITFCEGLLSIMMGEVLNDSNRVDLRKALEAFFKEYKVLIENNAGSPEPPLGLIMDHIKQVSKSSDMSKALERWTYGRKGELFNSGVDDVQAADFVYFDLQDLDSAKEEMSAIIFSIFAKIMADVRREEILNKRKFLVMDEAHRYLQIPEFNHWITQFFRLGRHYNIMPLLITQSIKDVINDQEWSAAIASNLKQGIMFAGDKDVGKAFKLLQMQDHHIQQYNTMNKELREFILWRAHGETRVLQPIADPYTYWISTTDPIDRKLRASMKDLKGNMNDAINQLVMLTAGLDKRDQKQKAVDAYLKGVNNEKTA
jgi:type IV secretory pathway VirB4 component